MFFKNCLCLFLGVASIAIANEPQHMRAGVRHIEGKGVGYNTGYTTIETFLAPSPQEFPTLPFVDLRGHIFDDGRWAANGGCGVRSWIGSRIYGLNVYYDYRNSKRSNYNQVSCGIESLGSVWDFRWNGYFPVGSRKSRGFDLGYDTFAGNSLYLTRKFEYALTGSNAEVGTHFARFRGISFYAAAGPYYFKGPLGPDLLGGQVRLNGNYNDFVTLEVSSSYDRVFRGIVQGQISFNFPLGPKSYGKEGNSYPRHCPCSRAWMYGRMVQPVVRNEIIVLDEARQQSLAIDPLTNLPYTIWFVDNTSHSAGTFESPFSTLADAESASQVGDIIYVFPGDLTTTGMDVGITLKDNQRLWGSAIVQSLPTTNGMVTIPALSSTSFLDTYPTIVVARAPQITSTTGSGDVVTIANNNEISGFYIQNLTGHGITSGSSVTDLTVINNIIQGPNATTTNKNQINLQNPQGTILIAGNVIYPYGTSSNQTNTGIVINSTSIQNANYVITDNDCPANGSFLVTTYTDCANISTTITNNAFNVFNFPVNMTFNNATAQTAHYVNIDNNSSYTDAGNTGSCFLLTLSNDANVNAFVTNNVLDTPYADGLAIVLTENSQMNLTMDGNDFFCWLTPVNVTLGNSSNLHNYQPKFTASITNNSLVFDEEPGINILAYDNALIPSLTISNNQLQGVLQNFGVVADNIYIETNQTATATTTIANNGIQAGTNGIALVSNNSSTQTATLNDNTFTHAQLYGITLTTNNTSHGTWTVGQNTYIAMPSGGVLATSNNTSTTSLGFTNNLAGPYQQPSGTGTYQFTNAGGTFLLGPVSGNTGKITETGVITPQ
ncbi:MAG: inverse autotransporter beta domain-containing protein [Chlamydiales bacterium]|nr:inverse autotransporter beta domain-containing protein [Chlamydiales bacterium]